MSGPPISLDEDAVRRVLARALEIENQQRGALTEAQVREVARELSISDAVIEQALSEYRKGAAGGSMVTRPRRLSRVVVTLLAILAILALFVLPRLAPPQ